ncbi:GDP-L-fucose synthase [Candidatus Beckwithbacteria bacterium]|nr:GDP-L-fucose synthase [Candidatus Beckwithbacteria bacterium]
MKDNFWQNKRVLITGAHGFLGSHLVRQLKKLKPRQLRIPTSKELDLTQNQNCIKAVENIDLVIHLAAKVGGIGFNQQYPGTLFYDNLVMGAHLMEAARKAGVKKFVALGTICAYPKFTPIPFKEENLWNGYPEETNAPYGLAKKMLLVQAQAYRQQYSFNAIFLLPVNLYGPGDNFDPKSSHVIPALIKKFIDAKESGKKTVTIWGTGNPTREFLYVEDAAKGIILASEKYNKADPVNLGSSNEISIRALVELIQELTEFKGQIIWDKTKPDGQPRRKLDISKAKTEFGFEASTDFKKGLKKTIEWYQKYGR